MSAGTAGLAPGFKERVEAWVAAGHGAFTVSSGLRTNAQQVALRKANGCPDIYKSPSSACRIPTAIPGTSKHEEGLAADVTGDTALAARLAPQFGLGAPVPRDPNHYESTVAVTGVKPSKGGLVDQTVGAVAGLGGDLVDATVGPLITGLKRITITGLVLAGGFGLILAGAWRSSNTAKQLGNLGHQLSDATSGSSSSSGAGAAGEAALPEAAAAAAL